MKKRIPSIIFLVVVVFVGFTYRDTLKNVWMQTFSYYFPCKQPITYSIGTFDTEFDMSKKDFLEAVQSAEAIWEKPINKNLFQYETNGNLKINLIYDIRQEVTTELKNMGLVVDNNMASYNELKSKYNSLISQHDKDNILFESRLKAFEIRRDAYESEVVRTNKRGGATPELASRLNAEREYLNQETTVLKQLQDNLNKEVNNINALVVTINELATYLNIDVKKFNTIGDSLPREFDEGVYKSGPEGQEINVYQFDNKTKLIRVLAHEFGHALGLDHVDDPKAIMYRLNNGVNETLTAIDISELKTLCGIK